MATMRYQYAGIKGICTVIPHGRVSLDDEIEFYPDVAKLQRLKVTVGLGVRTISAPTTTPTDLMESAAEVLLSGMNVDRASIDAIVCVLDYPDYWCPPSACVLHGKLHLPESCMAFDINHGCAGYLYGLNVAFSLVESSCSRVLLLVGDTKSKVVNVRDRVSAPLFGDGAAATLIERSAEPSPSFFVLGANGAEYENIMVPAGGARMPTSAETIREVADEYGNVRSLNNFRMNGHNVFDFTMKAVPRNICETLEAAGCAPNDIDYYILHQANKSIIRNIAASLGVRDLSKVPTDPLAKYGNLSVASVPCAINESLNTCASTHQYRVLLSGFGVGLAYGSAVITLKDIYCPAPLVNNKL